MFTLIMIIIIVASIPALIWESRYLEDEGPDDFSIYGANVHVPVSTKQIQGDEDVC